MAANRGLGRGLSALLGAKNTSEFDEDISIGERMAHVDIEKMRPGIYQPRKTFDPESLYELSDSIKKNGLIQPIIVAKEGDEYFIIAGERRWRACKIAGLKEVAVIIKDVKTKEMLEYALIENIQRLDLNIIEEAEGYLRLMGEFGYTQEELGVVLGKSRSHVANILRLNTLPESIKAKLLNGSLSMGQARTLVGHTNAEEIAEVIVDKGLNVRQTENLVKNWNKAFSGNKADTTKGSYKGEDDLKELVEALSNKFGMKVGIERAGEGGKIIFYYNNLEQLDDILTKLT